MSFVSRISLLPLLLCGCQAVGDLRTTRLRVDAVEPAAAAGATTPTTPTPQQQSPEELAIWRSDAFRRQFVQSYLAETDVEPRLSTADRDLMQKVYDLLADDKQVDAMKLLSGANDDAANAVVDFTIANLHFQAEQLEQASAAYRIAVDKFPRFRRAWRNLALVQVRRGEHLPAIESFTRVVELGGADSTTYGLLGYSYGNVEAHLAAETAYRMAVLMDGKLLDWQLGLARSLFKQERFAEAASLCVPLLRQDPDRGDFWMLQANAYLGMGDSNKAAENLEMLDRLGQATAESLNMLGDIYVNGELFDLAVGAYLRAIDAGQKSPERAMRAARVLTSRGAVGETRRLLDAMDTAYGPKLDAKGKKELLLLRSRLAMAEGAGEEEAQALLEIVTLDPLDGEALILLGQHSQRTGNPERAAFYYERAANIEGFEADAKVRHAQLLISQSKYRQALPLLKRAQAIAPRDNVATYLEQIERLAGVR